MYVEEVCIDGFKSYAQRTIVPQFDQYFNAITGLNGSGKSNILDSYLLRPRDHEFKSGAHSSRDDVTVLSLCRVLFLSSFSRSFAFGNERMLRV